MAALRATIAAGGSILVATVAGTLAAEAFFLVEEISPGFLVLRMLLLLVLVLRCLFLMRMAVAVLLVTAQPEQ